MWGAVADSLVIRGAREHNLRNVSLDLPRDKLIVFTGLSGSGKSSLAFDTIYAEGQRRYVESLSSYARQFLGQMDKPDVDFIEGLSPAISIDQKSASRNPRSTVGTITEVYDYLRLLFARIGIPHCPECGAEVIRQTPQQIVDRVMELPDGTRFQVLAPVVRGRKGTYETLLADLAAQGFARARVDGEVRETSERVELARYEQHTIEVIVDRLVRRDGLVRRLTDSLETALKLTDGVAEVQIVPRNGGPAVAADADVADDAPIEEEILTFSQHLACPNGHGSFEELAPRNFSFNSPYGACETCDGLGTRFKVDPELIVPNPDLSLEEGAIAPWAGGHQRYFQRLIVAVAEEVGVDMDAPFSSLTAKQRQAVLYGKGIDKVWVKFKNRYGRERTYHAAYEGVIPYLERRHGDAESDAAREQVEGYMREVPCAACGGARLRPLSLAVTIDGHSISDIADMSIGEAAKALSALELSERDRLIAERVVKEINARIGLPARRRARLPHPVPLGRHAGRRRGPAHPAGVADRLRPGRRAVRARRAVDRAPPARQPAAHRHAHPAARARQHRPGRRARRGDHQGRRPRGRHRAGRGRARWRDRAHRHGQGAAAQPAVDHRPVPGGQAVDPDAGDAADRRASAGSRSGAPASTTSRTSTSSSRSGASWR